MNLRSILKYVIVLACLFMLNSAFAGHYKISQRFKSSDLTTGNSFELKDEKYETIASGSGSSFFDHEVHAKIILGIDKDIPYTGAFGINIPVTITGYYYSEEDNSFQPDVTTTTLTVSYSSLGEEYQELDLVYKKDYHKVVVTLGTITETVPANVFLEAVLDIERYYHLDLDDVEVEYNDIQLSKIDVDGNGTDDELRISWPFVRGAESYDVEWLHEDAYQPDGTLDYVDGINAEDFKKGATRINTPYNTYTIPLVYDYGGVGVRIRPVGVKSKNQKLYPVFGRWSEESGSIDKIAQLSGVPHHNEKNWQITSVFAEGGKRGDIVTYHDGLNRQRQTVAKNLSSGNVVVSKPVFDALGRPAIQLPPTPIPYKTMEYYTGVTKNTTGQEYSYSDFQEWLVDENCESYSSVAAPMDESDKLSYYSDNSDEFDNDVNRYLVPQSEGYPFVQTIFEPDATGRVRFQGNVGDDLQIAGGKNVRIYYLKPSQEELYALFGTEVGDRSHYTKVITKDQNGQMAVSILDEAQRVIASGLTGDAPENLQSVSGYAGDQLDIDLLGKELPNDPDTDEDENVRSNSPDKFVFFENWIVTQEAENTSFQYYLNHTFDGTNYTPYASNVYNIQINDPANSPFEPYWEPVQGGINPDLSYLDYPIHYDVLIDVRNECDKQIIGDVATNVTTYASSNLGETGLEKGEYTIKKELTVIDHLYRDKTHFMRDAYYGPGSVGFTYEGTPEENEHSDFKEWHDFYPGDFQLNCDGTCEDCLTDLQSQFGSLSPQLKEDLGLYDLEQELYLTCISKCAVPKSCEGELIQMRSHIRPGGIFGGAEGEPNWNTSIYNPSGVFASNVNALLTELGVSSQTELLENWNDDYLNTLVTVHPDYCKWQECNEQSTIVNNITSLYFDQVIHAIEDASELASISFNHINTIEIAGAEYQYEGDDQTQITSLSSFFEDGFSVSSFQSVDPYSFTLATYDIEGIATGVNILDYAKFLAYCSQYYGTSAGGCYTAALDYDWETVGVAGDNLRNRAWNNFKQMYFSQKELAIQNAIHGNNDANCNYSGLETYTSVFQVEPSDIEEEFNFVIDGGENVSDLASNALIEETGICPLAYEMRGFLEGVMSIPGYESILTSVNTQFIDGYTQNLHDQLGGHTGVTTSLNAAETQWTLNLAAGYNIKLSTDDPNFPWGNQDVVVYELMPDPTAGNKFVLKVQYPVNDVNVNDILTGIVTTPSGENGIDFLDCEVVPLPIVSEKGLLFKNLLNTLAENSFPINADLTIDPYAPFLPVLEELYSYNSYNLTKVSVPEGIKYVVNGINGAEVVEVLNFTLAGDLTGVNGIISLDVTSTENVFDVEAVNATSTEDLTLTIVFPAGISYADDSPFSTTITTVGLNNQECVSIYEMEDLLLGLVKKLQATHKAYGSNVCNDGLSGDPSSIIGGSTWNEFTESDYLGGSKLLFEAVGLLPLDGDNDFMEIHAAKSEIPRNAFQYKCTNGTTEFSYNSDKRYAIKDYALPFPEYIDDDVFLGHDKRNYTHYSQLDEMPFGTNIITMRIGSGNDGGESNLFDYTTEVVMSPFPFQKILEPTYDLINDECTETISVPDPGGSDPVASSEPTMPCDGLMGCNTGGFAPSAAFMIVEDAIIEKVFITERTAKGAYFEMLVKHELVSSVTGELSGEYSDYKRLYGYIDNFTDVCDRPCTPPLDPPLSCNSAYEIYEDEILIGVLSDFDESNKLSKEDFCAYDLQSSIDEYKEYLIGMEITSITHSDYIDLIEFDYLKLKDFVEHYITYTEAEVIDNPIPLQLFAEAEVSPELVDFYIEDTELSQLWRCTYPISQPNPNFEPYTICYPISLVNPPISVLPDPCEELNEEMLQKAKLIANYRYDLYLDELEAAFVKAYQIAIDNTIEQFSQNRRIGDYQYTLFYYDQAGSLVKTVPPAGVKYLSESGCAECYDFVNGEYNSYNAIMNAIENEADAGGDNVVSPGHLLETEYKFNSIGEMVYQESPDAGRKRYWYDALGRLVLSQSAEQRKQKKYSYLFYDELSRIIESGQVHNNEMLEEDYVFSTPITPSVNEWASGPKEYMLFTTYDEALEFEGGFSQENPARNLRNRISYVRTKKSNNAKYESTIVYSYDIHGNVEAIAQRMLLIGDKYFATMLEYDYELFSGNVKQVSYQKGKPDQFFHRYFYDEQNRIVEVETSHDGITWEKDAKYDYYRHGALARTEIGDKQVQALEYAYTLQGWLKGVNHASQGNGYLASDFHNDGLFNAIATDAYGYELNYYDGDYTSVKGYTMESALASTDLYNGNISKKVTAFHQSDDFDPMAMAYGYDQLSRIKEMTTDAHANGLGYATSYAYDPNGNLESLNRSNKDGVQFDELVYHYNQGFNQLNRITDDKDAELELTDIEGQGKDNYIYDLDGNLTQDEKENIASIEWLPNGKVDKIIQTKRLIYDENGDLSDVEGGIIEYSYNSLGLRQGKIYKPYAMTESVDEMVSPDEWEITYYSRDLTGNIMSTYSGSFSSSDQFQLKANDSYIYGASRVGTYSDQRNVANGDLSANDPNALNVLEANLDASSHNVGLKSYELTDHLGNVMAVVNDNRIAVTGGPSNLIQGNNSTWSTTTSATKYATGDNLDVFTTAKYAGAYVEIQTEPGQSYSVEVSKNDGSCDAIGISVLAQPYDGDLVFSQVLTEGIETIEFVAATNLTRIKLQRQDDGTDTKAFTIDYINVINKSKYEPVVLSESDYYPFGMVMPDRSNVGADGYNHGFNGMEKDNTIKGLNNSYNTEYRFLDPRIGRWLSIDPLVKKYPGQSPYSSFNNNPIYYADPTGLEGEKKSRSTTMITSEVNPDGITTVVMEKRETISETLENGDIVKTRITSITKNFVFNDEGFEDVVIYGSTEVTTTTERINSKGEIVSSSETKDIVEANYENEAGRVFMAWTKHINDYNSTNGSADTWNEYVLETGPKVVTGALTLGTSVMGFATQGQYMVAEKKLKSLASGNSLLLANSPAELSLAIKSPTHRLILSIQDESNGQKMNQHRMPRKRSDQVSFTGVVFKYIGIGVKIIKDFF